jgi:hypothetical protein
MSCVIYPELLSVLVHYTVNMILEKVELALLKVIVIVLTD